MSIEKAVRVKDVGVELDIIVSPRSSRSGAEGMDEWRNRLIIKVKAPPLDGKANREVEELLTETLGYKATVTAGHTSRQKTVFIEGDPQDILSRLRGSNG